MTDDVWRAMEFSDFAREGAWPQPGGTLDQAAVFLEAHRRIQADRAEGRARQAAGDFD